MTKLHALRLTCAATALLAAGTASADEITFLCYQDGNECDVYAAIAEGFNADSGHTVVVETVSYEVIRDQLENQLQTGAAPDVARITNTGGLNPYYLDLTPFVDAAYFEENYGAVLPWYRAPGGEDQGIYAWPSQLTVTGPYVNVTMFDDADLLQCYRRSESIVPQQALALAARATSLVQPFITSALKRSWQICTARKRRFFLLLPTLQTTRHSALCPSFSPVSSSIQTRSTTRP